MIKAILFDIDNTLLDFDAFVRQSLRKGFAVYGLGEYTDKVYDVFAQTNRQMWGEIEAGTLTYEALMSDRFNRIFAKLGVVFDGVAFEEFFCKELFSSAIVMDGAMELLEFLHGRYVLCTASNGPYEQQVNRLRLAGMLPYFEHLFISEKVGYAKPAKEFFEHCLQALAVAPDEVLMVGDSYHTDILGAKACGIKTCYLGRGESDYCADSLRDIHAIV